MLKTLVACLIMKCRIIISLWQSRYRGTMAHVLYNIYRYLSAIRSNSPIVEGDGPAIIGVALWGARQAENPSNYQGVSVIAGPWSSASLPHALYPAIQPSSCHKGAKKRNNLKATHLIVQGLWPFFSRIFYRCTLNYCMSRYFNGCLLLICQLQAGTIDSRK